MKTAIIAGAGHGGLVAGAKLAENGWRVILAEKGDREGLGYDWEDTMPKSAYEEAGLATPPEDELPYMERMCYYSANKQKPLPSPGGKSKYIVYADRKELLKSLVKRAEDAGVELLFGCEILWATYETNRVTGVTCRYGEETITLKADIVIDAAGMDSPVRRSLPAHFGIEREISRVDTIHVWRGYYANTTGERADPAYNVYFFHCGKPGMDWAITNDDNVDILVGAFGHLRQSDVDEAIADFRTMYPQMGDTLIRGGQADHIPIRRTLPVFVFNGYAAVGNSACMTEPLSGSGIMLSIRAGNILADTLIQSGGDTTAWALWPYNRDYIRKCAEPYYGDLIIKKFLAGLKAEDVDFFIDKNILTVKELTSRGDPYTARALVEKLNLLRRPDLLPGVAKLGAGLATLQLVKSALPEEYDRDKLKKWREAAGRM
ncbi:MAG: NAD(P)/FAD-dependent oxidoreductase [Clostridia bacterium]|nr:NAD(P)/FAD-dependent oxidoreductase [Clostridia bacterium]